ncbi:rhomboid family intramembrane serine protease [Namhaeicola litoreus]|uniref:Rhomboid family intramembrane serine protease n=1 Tax=Namhaeicola litoreus TaxID=1052145 RepID=A0ABW3Y350_9FLAO
MQLLDTITDKFSSANVVMKMIYITAFIFLISLLLNTVSFFFNSHGNFLINWFALSPNLDSFLSKPWTILSYGFLHDGFFHIIFNLLVLYYFGTLFLDYFNSKTFLNYYFLGILVGGIVFLLSYNFLPALKSRNALLVGASAGVMSILIGLATLIPNYAMRFQWIGFIKLKHVALFVVILDILQIPMGNAGGHLAHLGGALTGFLLTQYFPEKKSQKSKNVFFSRKNKENNLKTVYKSKKPVNSTFKKSEDQQKIDHILDKISKSGYEALSKEEKQFLFDFGKK